MKAMTAASRIHGGRSDRSAGLIPLYRRKKHGSATLVAERLFETGEYRMPAAAYLRILAGIASAIPTAALAQATGPAEAAGSERPQLKGSAPTKRVYVPADFARFP